MKTLEKCTMIYDADCPLCMAYTNAFVQTKMLDKDGRIPYQQVGGSFCPGIDAERAKNEIALVDRVTGEVKYGLESLLYILSYNYPWIGKIGRWKPVRYFVQRLYNFISYNRKVIIPPDNKRVAVMRSSNGTDPSQQLRAPYFDCTPSFNLKYRIAYIVFTWFITSLVLVQYSALIGDLIPPTNFLREFLICGGQVVFQFFAVGLFLKLRSAVPLLEVRRRAMAEKIMEYLGNMMTVSLMGAFLLIPAIVLGNLLPGIPAEVFLIYFMCVVGIMLYEHIRRMKILELGWWPSISWVLYRCIVMVIIII